MKLVITDVEFDYSEEDDTLSEYVLEELDNELWNQFVGTIYSFDDQDSADNYLADLISEESGFSVKSVRYEVI